MNQIRTARISLTQKVIFLAAILISFSSQALEVDDAKNPMYFDVVGDGVTILPIELDYDVTADDGSVIRMGPHKMDSGNFFADVVQLGRLDSKLSPLLPKESAKEWLFLFRWPEEFMHEGKLEMISRAGRVLWERNIGYAEKEAWRKEMAVWKEIMAKNGYDPKAVGSRPIFNVQYGVRDIEKLETPFFTLNESFRVCFTRKQGPGMTRMCTPHMEMNRDGGRLKIRSVPLSPQPARVIIMGETAKLTDVIFPPLNKPISFFAENKFGISYEFFALPRRLTVIDMVKESEDKISIALSGEEPLTPSIRINDRLNLNLFERFFEKIGWQETIGDFRKFWRTSISIKDPYVMVDGIGGGSFKQKFKIDKVPTEDLRPKIEDRTFNTTYGDGTKIFGTKAKGTKLSSRQNSLTEEPGEEGNFTWKFGAKKKGEINHSYLTIEKDGKSFRAYHEAYRGYQAEVSARMSGIADITNLEQKPILLGEVAYNYWFEDLMGWSNYYLARQRWGYSAKFFQSITELEFQSKTGNSSSSGPMSVLTFDLKYRLNPGLWARDESWGFIWGLQHFTFSGSPQPGAPVDNKYTSLMYGPGVFWARSMPRILDDIMSWFPFMKYPKWVDMELIMYPFHNTPNLDFSSTGNFAVNFHGQIMWSKRFFGEAGFGYKRYEFNKLNPERLGQSFYRQQFTFNAFYGTAGIGIRF